MVTLLYTVRDLELVRRPHFFHTQMTESKHLNHVLILISFYGFHSAPLVWIKTPHLSITESQADENCQCLFIKKKPCQTNLFYFLYDPLINQHSVTGGVVGVIFLILESF